MHWIVAIYFDLLKYFKFIRHPDLNRSVGPPASIHDETPNTDVIKVLMDSGSEAGMTVAE